MRVYFLSKQKVLLSDHLWKYAIYNKQQQNSVGHFLNQKEKQKKVYDFAVRIVLSASIHSSILALRIRWT